MFGKEATPERVESVPHEQWSARGRGGFGRSSARGELQMPPPQVEACACENMIGRSTLFNTKHRSALC
jgi:hypothetical protein